MNNHAEDLAKLGWQYFECPACGSEGARAFPKPAQQAPVAWMHVMDNTEGIKANGKGLVSITQKRKHPFGKPGIDFSKSYPVTSTPLYTTPPQRKPLTDEEIEMMWQDYCKQWKTGERIVINFVDFARAIEAAHDIKGEA